MSTQPTVRTREEILAGFVRRFITYQDEVTQLGPTSTVRAFGRAVAAEVERAGLYYVGLLRRRTLMAASGDALTEVLSERGSSRLGASRSRVLVVVVPETANVAGIRNVAGDDYIEIDNSVFQAADSIRVRNQDGTTTEIATVASISAGTGPVNGDDELVITGGLANAYTPGSEDVDVLFRATVPVETSITTDAGVGFETLEELTTGDANPVLDGEGSDLALADKVWSECTVAGATGQIGPKEVSGLGVTIRGIKEVYNPAGASGGDAEETDFAAKRRAMNRPTLDSQETIASLLALAQEIDTGVLRIIKVAPTALNQVRLKILHRSGGAMSATELTELGAGMSQYMATGITVLCENITLTSVECEYRVTLDSDADLETVWREASSRLSALLDLRKREAGVAIDEAELLSTVLNTPGIGTIESATAVPAADVSVSSESFPNFTRLSLEDIDSGTTINAELASSF